MDKKTLTSPLSKTPKTPKAPKLSFTTTPVKTIKMRKVCKPAIFNSVKEYFQIVEIVKTQLPVSSLLAFSTILEGIGKPTFKQWKISYGF